MSSVDTGASTAVSPTCGMSYDVDKSVNLLCLYGTPNHMQVRSSQSYSPDDAWQRIICFQMCVDIYL